LTLAERDFRIRNWPILPAISPANLVDATSVRITSDDC
jgi:hypothetical protein